MTALQCHGGLLKVLCTMSSQIRKKTKIKKKKITRRETNTYKLTFEVMNLRFSGFIVDLWQTSRQNTLSWNEWILSSSTALGFLKNLHINCDELNHNPLNWNQIRIPGDTPRPLSSQSHTVLLHVHARRYILHAKKTAFVVEHDFIMATYLADRVIVFDGIPSKSTSANA